MVNHMREPILARWFACCRSARWQQGGGQRPLTEDPFSGVVVIFRSKRADRLKMVTWDGSGLVLVWKRLEHSTFRWPPITDGVMRLSPAQMAALFDGMDWSRLHARDVARPTATS